jgi:hypothetical protein
MTHIVTRHCSDCYYAAVAVNDQAIRHTSDPFKDL